MSEPFDAARWYASLRAAGQDVLAVEFIEHDVELAVIGRAYDHARDSDLWAPLTEHREAIIDFLNRRHAREEAA